MSACLTLYWPLICLAMSSESLTTSTSVAPSARAARNPRSTARYSATLLVATPMVSLASPTTSPSGVVSTAAAAAGPGLPREPPSTWTTRRTVLVRVDRRKLAGDAAPAPVADRPLLGLLGCFARCRAALALAPVDDDLHVRVVGVVIGELVIELVGHLLGDHAIDHLRRGIL